MFVIVTTDMNSEPAIRAVDRLDLTFAPKPWAFAQERRAEIDAHFAKLRLAKPALWNGRLLLLHDHELTSRVLRGGFLEADFASLAAWRDWGFPDAGAFNCFGAAAVCTGDGAVLLGVMGPHTVNAGQIYFPCGTPDPDDIVDGRVDFDRSVARELAEETGIDASALTAEPGWTLVRDGRQLILIKALRTPDSAETLRQRVLAHLAGEREPELSDIRLVRSMADLGPAMPGFVAIYLKHRWR